MLGDPRNRPAGRLHDRCRVFGTPRHQVRASVTLTHPCQHAAAHLPCTRPSDVPYARRPVRARPGARDRCHLPAFVITRAGTATGGLHPLCSKLSRHLLPRAVHLEGMKMLRPPLQSLAQLLDPFVVLRLLHRRTTCGHRRFELLANCVHAARPLRSWVHRASHVSGGHFLYLLLLVLSRSYSLYSGEHFLLYVFVI